MIEIEGLPEGWKAVAYRRPIKGEQYLHQAIIWKAFINEGYPCLIVEKIKPRRIVLEEISKEEYHRLFNDERCSDIYNMRGSYWREVKETEEPKLSLSVDECKEAMRKLETFNVTDLSVKICRFLKDK